jgi:hypothetical protein
VVLVGPGEHDIGVLDVDPVELQHQGAASCAPRSFLCVSECYRVLLVGMCYEDSACAFHPWEGKVRARDLSFSLKLRSVVRPGDVQPAWTGARSGHVIKWRKSASKSLWLNAP